MGENILLPPPCLLSGKVFLSRAQGHVPDLTMTTRHSHCLPSSQESLSPTTGQTEAIQEWVFCLLWPQE